MFSCLATPKSESLQVDQYKYTNQQQSVDAALGREFPENTLKSAICDDRPSGLQVWAPQCVVSPAEGAGTHLNSQASSCSVFSVWRRVTGHPLEEYLQGNITVLATFSMARLRMLPVKHNTFLTTPGCISHYT